MSPMPPQKNRRGRSQSTAPNLSPVAPALLDPVERQAYRSIRQGLMSGLIAPGTMLSGRSLATQLCTSVQPVRDALKRLEADGVVEGRPHSGFFLRDPTAAEFVGILEIRQRLEGLAARLAAASITPALIKSLRSVNRKMRFADTHEYLALNHSFHFGIYAQARHGTLLSLIENLWMRIGPVLHYYPIIYNREAAVATHERIIQALVQRDGDLAEAAIRFDLNSAADLILPHLPQTSREQPRR